MFFPGVFCVSSGVYEEMITGSEEFYRVRACVRACVPLCGI